MTDSIPKLKTNLDTDFLKLVAILSMLIDHIGANFFPQYAVFRWLGRLAFPLFCYCMTVGLLYTHDIWRYLGRLALFAAISQPFYALNANPADFWGNLTNWNIFFTLFLSLLFMWGVTHRGWPGVLAAVASLAALCIWNFDYSFTGIILMLIFYFCRNRPALGAGLYFLSYLPAFWGVPGDPLALMVGGRPIDWTAFSLLAMPLIFIPTHTGIKINRWFFYVFYPAHIALIVLVKWALGSFV